MANVNGIAIVIKAFMPTGKTLDEQFAALSAVEAAHETGDYASLLANAKIEEVKTEQKTRRVEARAAGEQPKTGDEQTDIEDFTNKTTTDGPTPTPAADDADVPAFLKEGKKGKAA